MGAISLILIVVAVFFAWGLIRIGVQIGGSKMARYIVEGFIRTLDLKSDSEEINEINLRLKDLGWWYDIRGVANYICEIRSSAIGEALAKAGLSQGAEFQRVWDAPKTGEAAVTMNRQELYDIAWLADYGLRVWTMSSKNKIRVGDRLPRERAEILSDLLDRFERKVADLLTESENDREMRFTNHEDRMKRMWENYG